MHTVAIIIVEARGRLGDCPGGCEGVLIVQAHAKRTTKTRQHAPTPARPSTKHKAKVPSNTTSLSNFLFLSYSFTPFSFHPLVLLSFRYYCSCFQVPQHLFHSFSPSLTPQTSGPVSSLSSSANFGSSNWLVEAPAAGPYYLTNNNLCCNLCLHAQLWPHPPLPKVHSSSLLPQPTSPLPPPLTPIIPLSTLSSALDLNLVLTLAPGGALNPSVLLCLSVH